MTESLTFASIFLLGCLHALEPGHGKTFLLAYSVGQRLDIRKITTLTFGLLFSHFFILSTFSIFFNIFLSKIVESFLHNFSHWFAPIIIFSFGVFTTVRATYQSKHKHNDNCGHEHGKFPNSKIRNPFTIGILTGLMPCASSLAVVMISGVNKNILSVLYFICTYVLGIALVLFSIVSMFSFTKKLLLSRTEFVKKRINLELVSGYLIILVGLAYLSYNWGSHAH